jgi:Uma2 family endonuclease
MTTLAPPAVETTRRMTLSEFEQYIALPENADRRLQWHHGEVFEVVAHFDSTNVSGQLFIALGIYLRKNRIGVLGTSEAGFIVNGARYQTDGAFILKERRRNATFINGFMTIAPDLAIESISPTDRLSDIIAKLKNYEAAGTVVWLIDYRTESITVFVPGQEQRTLNLDDVLDGGELLPGFSVPVREIFADLIMMAEEVDADNRSDSDGPTAP